MEEQQAGRDEERRPEDEAEEAGAEEDVDDPANDGEDLRNEGRDRFRDLEIDFYCTHHLCQHGHAVGGPDETCVHCQTHFERGFGLDRRKKETSMNFYS